MKLRSDIFNEKKPIHEQNGENSTEKWKTKQHFESMSNQLLEHKFMFYIGNLD